MKEGDIILTPVPQANGKIKRRPAILLREMPSYKDFLVCGVSTQTHQFVEGFDELISPADVDYVTSGLLSASVIRLGFLAILPRKNIAGTIGSISSTRHKRLLKTLSKYLIQ